MAIYRDEKTGTYRVVYRYTDFTGVNRQTSKRGFRTKKEAEYYEAEMRLKLTGSVDMTLASFFELYEAYKRPRVKDSTWETKAHMVRTKILPYLGKRKMNEITANDVIAWQNVLLSMKKENGKKYSRDYLRTIHAQLSALFNCAVNLYDLPSNPAKKAGVIQNEEKKEMSFWTKEEYLRFANHMMDKPRSFYAFEMLYWTGIREGELLALMPEDFDFEKGTVSITKTFYRKNKQDVITSPKTPQSYRKVVMPSFLMDEMKEYLELFYSVKPGMRIFNFTKSYLLHEMQRGCKAEGMKPIRIHDLRHSHVSLLIHMGFTALAIGKRVGHTAEKITYKYAHLFPTIQAEMAERLEMEHLKKGDIG